MTAHLFPAVPQGTALAPPSKSMAHRLLIGAALSGIVSHIAPVAYSDDILATLQALRQLGAQIICRENEVEIQGGPGPFSKPGAPVDCGQSASTLRMLLPLFSLTGGAVRFTGAPGLLRRPMDAYRDIFEAQGLAWRQTAAHIEIEGALRAGSYTVAGGRSSQFVSGLLLALPLLPQASTLHLAAPVVSRSYIEQTRTAQALFGVTSHWEAEHTLAIPGGQHYRGGPFAVEGDWTQAAVMAVLGALCGGLAIDGLPRQTAQGDRVILSILERCGCPHRWQGDTLHIASPATLAAPGTVDLTDCPDLGPILCVLALFCSGETTLTGAGRLRDKESDRPAAIAAECHKLGLNMWVERDTIRIPGGQVPRGAARVHAHGDHRIVMALAVLAIGAGVELWIDGAQAVDKSWPGFFGSLRALGVRVELDGHDT